MHVFKQICEINGIHYEYPCGIRKSYIGCENVGLPSPELEYSSQTVRYCYPTWWIIFPP